MASFRFLEDLQTLLTTELTGVGYPMPAGCDLDAAVMRYLNVVARVAPVLAWTLRTSRDLTSRVLGPDLRAGLDEFKRKATVGEDLRPNMSTRIGDADYVDRMFCDWHLFHFHLGTNLNANGFVSRTKELLFAIAERSTSTMFLLDVRDHGSFEDQDLLRIRRKLAGASGPVRAPWGPRQHAVGGAHQGAPIQRRQHRAPDARRAGSCPDGWGPHERRAELAQQARR